MCEGRGLAKRHLGGQNENNLVMKRLLSVKCYYASARHVGKRRDVCFPVSWSKNPTPFFCCDFCFCQAADKSFWMCRTPSFPCRCLTLNAVLKLTKLKEWIIFWYRLVERFGGEYCSTGSGNITLHPVMFMTVTLYWTNFCPVHHWRSQYVGPFVSGSSPHRRHF